MYYIEYNNDCSDLFLSLVLITPTAVVKVPLEANLSEQRAVIVQSVIITLSDDVLGSQDNHAANGLAGKARVLLLIHH